MNERDYKVEAARACVKQAQSKLDEAKRNREHGIRKAQAEYDQAVLRLNGECDRAAIDLQREEAWLKFQIAEQERGFEA